MKKRKGSKDDEREEGIKWKGRNRWEGERGN